MTLEPVKKGLIYAQLVDSDAWRFKLRELNWISKSASDARVLVIGKMSPFRSVADLQRHDKPALLGNGMPLARDLLNESDRSSQYRLHCSSYTMAPPVQQLTASRDRSFFL